MHFNVFAESVFTEKAFRQNGIYRIVTPSKQWQRLVFNKQQTVILRQWKRSYGTIIIIINKIQEKYKISIIERLTKKINFITNLEINFYINNKLLKIITENCRFLKKN